MDLQLNGKNAIIGASSEGLGKACALELAREGCNLVICGRREEVLHAAAKEVEAAGPGKLITVLADLATMEGQNAVLSAAHDNLGTVDILITNTGGDRRRAFLKAMTRRPGIALINYYSQVPLR